MNKSPIAKAGKLLMIDHGEYSDRSIMGFFVILKDFDPQQKIIDYLKIIKDDDSLSAYSFISLLIEKGYLLEIDYSNLYLGGYGLNIEDCYFKLAINE